jgi:hypothetical protein
LRMALRKWVRGGNALLRIPRPKSVLLVPVALPFGFDQVKRILSAT